MRASGVPTAESLAIARPPCVVKLDGLAAGKGVWVCRTSEELDAATKAAARAGGQVLIEELLEGDEVSVFAICDGTRALALPPARDFKRLAEGNQGPNTGGMGSYSPVAEVPRERLLDIVEGVHEPVLDELARRGSPFVGVLFAGLMLTDAGWRVLEFNCRFGDPETQSLLPRLEGDLVETLAAAASGDLGDVELSAGKDAAVAVVLAGGDYPARSDSGSPIDGVEDAEAAGAIVFHAGTAVRGGRLVTNGGRVLNVTARGESLAEARATAYAACELVHFPAMRYRRDIAAQEAGVAG
jgi:phosphoribosylamine---glycine ligase